MNERIVRVLKFPREKIILLIIHLESPRYKGGRVVKHAEGKDFVDVTFEDSAVAENFLDAGVITVDGIDYTICAPPMNQKLISFQLTGLSTSLNHINQELLLMYLENTGISGDDINILYFDPEKGCATFTLPAFDGLKEILENNVHQLCECRLKFLEISNDLADFKRLSCGIKVSMSRLISEFNIRLIFEKHGHTITKVYINEAECTATITYASPRDLEVYREICSFEGTEFKVHSLIPIFSPSMTGDVLSDRYILTNLPLIFDNGDLIQYLNEHLMGKEISRVYYARSKPCNALIVFKLQQDFESLQRVLYSKPFLDKMLGVVEIQKPNSIQVFNVSGLPTKEIRNYFESDRFCNLRIKKDFYGDDFALLWFEDPACLEEIVNAGDYTLQDKELKLSLHYEQFGIIYPTEDNSDCKCWLQKYVSVKWEANLVNFLLKSDNNRKSLEAELEKRYAIIAWPKDLVEEDIEIRIKLEKHKTFALHELQTWEKDCLQLIRDLKKKFHVCKIKLTMETHYSVASQLFDFLGNSESYIKLKCGEIRIWRDILVHYEPNFLILSGLRLVVDNIQKRTNDIQLQEEKKMHQSSLVKTKDLSLKPIQIDFLKKKQNQKLFNFNVDCDFKESCVSLIGLPENIRKAEVEIYKLLSKSLFKRIDCRSFIVELVQGRPEVMDLVNVAFQEANLTVALSVSGSQTLLIQASNKDEADAALSILYSKLVQKEILLDENMQETLFKTEWDEKIKELKTSYSLIINCNEARLSISGLMDEVDAAFQSINSYFDKHAFYEKRIIIPKSKHSFIILHMADQVKKLLREHDNVKLNKLEIPLEETQCPRCRLSGTRPNVEAMEQKVEGMLNEIKLYKKIIPMDKFKVYANTPEGSLALKAIAGNTKTLVEDCDPTGGDEEFDNELKARVSLGQKLILDIVHGCLLKSQANVIVNAANERLCHAGGIAKVIAEAAGPELTNDCKSHVEKNGELKVGKVFISKPGNLKFEAVLHAVGPTYRSSEKVEREKQLNEVMKNILETSEENQWSKIALPAISTGIYNFPLEVAADILLKCIKDFAENSRHLKAVEIVDISVEAIKVFQIGIKKKFHDKDILVLKEDLKEKNQPFERTKASNSKKTIEMSQLKSGHSKFEHSLLKLVRGSLVEQNVEVIVNSASADLDLTHGAVANLISNSAGPEMQIACNEYVKKKGKLSYGSIFVSDGFSLPVRFVFHGTCALYNNSNDLSEESIRSLTKISLKEASKRKLKSMALPVFGTGMLNVPADLAANWIYEETDKFFSNNPKSSLIDLRLVVYEKDVEVFQKIEKFLTSGRNEQKEERKLVKKTNSLYQQKSYSLNFQKLNVEVCHGDLTNESTDAIVNSTDNVFDFSKGGIAKAVIEKGGPKIREECKKLGKLEVIAVTSGGNLKCKHIFHVNLAKGFEVINECLKKAEEFKLSSLSFPLLMTGQYQKDLSVVLSTMLERFEKFAKRDQHHLKYVRVIVFDGKEMERAIKILKEQSGYQDKSIKGHSSQRFSKDHLYIFATSEKNADKALEEINDALAKNTKERIIENPVINKLDDDEFAAIITHAEEQAIDSIDIDKYKSRVTLKGISAKTSICESLIMDVIKIAVERVGKLEEAKSIAQQVQWYHKNVDFRKYPTEINLIIEKAFSAKQPKVSWMEDIGQYEIDFKTMQEYQVSTPSNAVQVKRMTENEVFPLTWDFTQNGLELVALHFTSQEYREVKRLVYSSAGNLVNSILKIERVQNASFYKRYSIAKEYLKEAFKNRINIKIEHRLWHTVGPTDITKDINNYGFNRFREIRPTHVADFGIGSYFFKSFSDVHQPQLDADGKRLAYLCLVLTGRYANGSPQLKDVPADFNSVVDDVTDPTIHVVFNDEQAYPEYLIHYN